MTPSLPVEEEPIALDRTDPRTGEKARAVRANPSRANRPHDTAPDPSRVRVEMRRNARPFRTVVKVGGTGAALIAAYEVGSGLRDRIAPTASHAQQDPNPVPGAPGGANPPGAVNDLLGLLGIPPKVSQAGFEGLFLLALLIGVVFLVGLARKHGGKTHA